MTMTRLYHDVLQLSESVWRVGGRGLGKVMDEMLRSYYGCRLLKRYVLQVRK